jgi:hypothetical protein
VPLAVEDAAEALSTSTKQRAARLRSLPLWAAVEVTLVLSAPLAAYSLTLLISYISEQLAGTPYPTDFLNYYSAGRMLLEAPSNLYRPEAEVAFQRQLVGGREVYAQFQNLPQLALLFAPLALLPYGHAYAIWCLTNLGLLVASARLLAPRISARWSGWLPCLLLALFFLPVEFALVDGQTSFVLLFGFSLWASCLDHSTRQRSPLWLLTWAWKPQLLPLPLLAVLMSRRFRSVAILVLTQVGVSGLVVLWAGLDSVQRYLDLSRVASVATLAREYLPGQTTLGLAQSLFGVGPIATVAAVLAAALIYAAVVSVWMGGPRPDSGRYLQFAVLPLAAVITAARANTYELTLWLASGWLMLRYVQEVQRYRGVLLAAVLVGWWGANLAFASERGSTFEWGTLAGIVMIAAIAWQFHTWPRH